MNTRSAQQPVLERHSKTQTRTNPSRPRPDLAARRPNPATQPQPRPVHKRAEYRILDGPNGIVDLELRVNDMLDQGWKLVGGLCFDRGCPYQAMARVTSDKIEPSVPPPTLSNF